jgi:subtilisin family serine protease
VSGAFDACVGRLIVSFVEGDRAAWSAMERIRTAGGFGSHFSMHNRVSEIAPEALERSRALRRYELELIEVDPGDEQAILSDLLAYYAESLTDERTYEQLPREPLIAGPNGLYSSAAGAAPGDFTLSSGHTAAKTATRASASSNAGGNVKVAIIDSGTKAANEPTSVVGRHDFTGGAATDVDDLRGHGSVVTAILGDIASAADYVICRVLDASGLASEWDVLAALFTVEDAHVVNVSLQSGLRDRTCSVCGRQTHRARSRVFERTIGAIAGDDGYPVVVAAAGNDDADQLAFPARFASSVAVGSVNAAGDRSGFSNYKRTAHPRHFVCPGGHGTAKDLGQSEWVAESTDGTIHWAGTSFAAAYASALLACRLSDDWLGLSTDAQRLIGEMDSDADRSASSYKADSHGSGLMRLPPATP